METLHSYSPNFSQFLPSLSDMSQNSEAIEELTRLRKQNYLLWKLVEKQRGVIFKLKLYTKNNSVHSVTTDASRSSTASSSGTTSLSEINSSASKVSSPFKTEHARTLDEESFTSSPQLSSTSTNAENASPVLSKSTLGPHSSFIENPSNVREVELNQSSFSTLDEIEAASPSPLTTSSDSGINNGSSRTSTLSMDSLLVPHLSLISSYSKHSENSSPSSSILSDSFFSSYPTLPSDVEEQDDIPTTFDLNAPLSMNPSMSSVQSKKIFPDFSLDFKDTSLMNLSPMGSPYSLSPTAEIRSPRLPRPKSTLPQSPPMEVSLSSQRTASLRYASVRNSEISSATPSPDGSPLLGASKSFKKDISSPSTPSLLKNDAEKDVSSITDTLDSSKENFKLEDSTSNAVGGAMNPSLAVQRMLRRVNTAKRPLSNMSTEELPNRFSSLPVSSNTNASPLSTTSISSTSSTSSSLSNSNMDISSPILIQRSTSPPPTVPLPSVRSKLVSPKQPYEIGKLKTQPEDSPPFATKVRFHPDVYFHPPSTSSEEFPTRASTVGGRAHVTQKNRDSLHISQLPPRRQSVVHGVDETLLKQLMQTDREQLQAKLAKMPPKEVEKIHSLLKDIVGK
ncbi:hypothetical protein HMI54_006123 [Coelomomyces lativittatus]|nr:hypothetical protein HMI56_003705 [Coelomomyces lativittatus]KAJ1505249.1 hypothetical protein HMI54_006123 [Coelomomyces lativittatus]KAJ1508813.1 hypothetical protein HMI55_000218 [Coelomomyces lativittatus]